MSGSTHGDSTESSPAPKAAPSEAMENASAMVCP
jgi:hypothetical protein